MWNEELYQRACEALYQRDKRRGYIPMRPNRGLSYFTETTIVLQNINGELGRYNTQKRRLIAERAA